VATKTPQKGKKTAAKEPAPRKTRAKAPAVEAAPKAEPAKDRDEDDEDDEELKAAEPAPKKPAARPRAGAPTDEPPPVVPARRLTPEAKARVNEMVKKGVSLTDALRAAASWETFVAPVKEEPAKLVQGRSFEGGGKPIAAGEEDDEEPEEPASSESED
jgi:hypothetical protein